MPGNDHSTYEEGLVRRASAGDRDALAVLVLRAQRRGAREAQARFVLVVRPGIQEHIRSYLVQRYRPSIVASWLEDITQDAVVEVLLGLADLRGDFWPWALVIARDAATKRVRAEIGMRRLQNALRSMSRDSDEVVDVPDESSIALQLSVHLRLACKIVLSELEGNQRQAFALWLDEVAPKEIAKTLGVKPQSIYTWKFRHQRMVMARCEELAAKSRAR